MAWINPKINWTGSNDERFNVDPDYLRIKGNIEYLADLCTKYYRNPNIISLQVADLTTIPYISFFNNVTADIDLISDLIGRTSDNESTCSFANQNSLYIYVNGIASSQYHCVYKATTANDTEAEASVTYNSSGDVITYDNALCESNTKATDLANWYYDYVKKGQKFTISYRGDPALEPFDFIYIQSQFEDEYVPVVVTKTTLDFDGGISGKIECIRV